MTSERRRNQVNEGNRKRRESLLRQYNGGGTVYYMTIETKQAIKDFQALMGYSNMTYAIDDLVRLSLPIVKNGVRLTIQKRLRSL